MDFKISPKHQFNGFYCDEAMSYEVYVWIRNLEKDVDKLSTSIEALEKVASVGYADHQCRETGECIDIAMTALEKVYPENYAPQLNAHSEGER